MARRCSKLENSTWLVACSCVLCVGGREVGKEGGWVWNDFDFHCPNLTDYRAKLHEVDLGLTCSHKHRIIVL